MIPQAIELCRHKFSVGGDGILVVSEVGEKHYKMTLITADGSIATNCGNGLRCVAVYLHKTKAVGLNFAIATDSGDKQADITITQNK